MEKAAAATSKMKGFYRQRKNQKTGTGISKKTTTTTAAASSKPSKDISPHHAHAHAVASSLGGGSDITRPLALNSLGSPNLHDDHDKNEQLLRQFDMNMAYGPCLGMTRIARWERAQRLGLNPPKEIEGLLKDVKVNPECLWDGRV
uniref:DNA polymerase delta subunit 4 n=1 Tax=Rhizophora mucronata TaxID=61149 RepID=A0A2P2MRU5_RHIMU